MQLQSHAWLARLIPQMPRLALVFDAQVGLLQAIKEDLHRNDGDKMTKAPKMPNIAKRWLSTFSCSGMANVYGVRRSGRPKTQPVEGL